MESVRFTRRRVGILLATMALAFALLPGTALAAGPADAGPAGADTVLLEGGGLASVASAELGRQHPEWKLVCTRSRDGSTRVCTRWRPAQCKVPRGEEVGMRNCAGNGPNARAIL